MKSKSDDREANLERENAELRRQLAESQAQQDALSEVLKGIAQPGVELAVVLQAVVAAAHRLCRADHTVLFRKDGDAYRWAAGHAMAGGSEERERHAVIQPGTGTLIGRAVFEGHPVQIEDAWTDPHYEAKEDAREGGIRTMLGVPLLREGEAIGAIGLARCGVEPFTEPQIALVENFAAQAVIAIENARLITETRDALDQQTATAEVLRVINASPGDPTPVFDAILEKAHRLCGATRGTLFLFDGETFRAAAMHGYPQAQPPRAIHVSEDARLAAFLAGERLIHIPDLTKLDDPIAQAVAERGGVRTNLLLPLHNGDRLCGVISCNREEVRPFSDKEIALLENFATQAAIAIENARLITETREALDQQTATAEVLQVINSSPGDLAPVFEAMLDKALQLCDASFGNLLTYDGEYFHLAASQRVPEAVTELFRQPYRPRANLQRLIDGEPFVQIEDLTKTRSYLEQNGTAFHLFADHGGARSIVFVPLRKEGALVGVMNIYRQEVCRFTERQIALLQNFAAQAVIAMENARLITETRENLERQTATSDILRVIAASPGDAEGTLRKIAETTMRLFNAAGASFRIADGNAYSSAIIVGRGAEDVSASLSDPDHLVRPQTLPGTVIHENRQIHLPDLDHLEPAFADWPGPPVFRKAGMRTLVGTPLRRQDRAFGALIVYRDELRPFTGEELQLLQSFADQAVIAMENARLLTETREALDQQTATAEVLGVINSSPGDLTPVFDAMLEKAVRLCEASYGLMFVVEGDRIHTVAQRNVPKAFSDYLAESPPQIGRDTMLGRALLDRQLMHTADPAAEAPYREGVPLAVKTVELGGARAFLMAPLTTDEAVLGIFAVFRTEARPFSDKQVALTQNFAAQAVIAMENARLITETREALEQQTATAEVLGVINSSPGDLAPVFEAMLEKAVRLCDAAFGVLHVVEEGLFGFGGAHSAPAELVEVLRDMRSPAEVPGSTFALLRAGAAIAHAPDIAASEIYRSERTPMRRAFVDIGGARTCLVAALRKDDELLGALGIYRREVRPFTDKQIALLQNFAAQAVIAMENARLLGELRQRTEEVAELNRGLEARVAEQVDELGRVGRLKSFLAPQLAELIVSQGDEKILESHRREIVVVFCDLRGYTAFTETAEPEEVLDFLREYHGALGPLVSQYEGTLDQFSGDGIMVFFNDPVPIPDPAERAVKMAMAMREAASALTTLWRRRGRELGFGAGIAQGYATLGQIGFSERSGYTAIGTVCNVAARLCAEAKDGQILIAQRVAAGLDGDIALEDIGPLALKGITQPVAAFNVAPDGIAASRLRLV